MAQRAALPAALGHSVEGFERYLLLERGYSRHTARAYAGDVVSLLDYAAGLSVTEPSELDLGVLRGWLARLRSSGAARSTLARRAAAARTFTGWLRRSGLTAEDAGELLASPRPHRTLPSVLGQDEAALMMAASAATRADPQRETRRDAALLLRDRLIAELLYATGIRVAEWSVSTPATSTGANVCCGCLAKDRRSAASHSAYPLIGRCRHGWISVGPRSRQETADRAVAQGRAEPHRPPHRASGRASAGVGGARRARRGPARAPAQRGDAHGRGWRRPPVGSGTTRPRQPRHHPAVHARLGGTSAPDL